MVTFVTFIEIMDQGPTNYEEKIFKLLTRLHILDLKCWRIKIIKMQK